MGQEKTKNETALQQIKDTLELFYQQKNGEALLQFQSTLGNMMVIVDNLFVYKQNHDDWEMDENKIQDTLVEAMNALEEKDYILLADVLQYDFLEYVEALLSSME